MNYKPLSNVRKVKAEAPESRYSPCERKPCGETNQRTVEMNKEGACRGSEKNVEVNKTFAIELTIGVNIIKWP